MCEFWISNSAKLEGETANRLGEICRKLNICMYIYLYPFMTKDEKRDTEIKELSPKRLPLYYYNTYFTMLISLPTVSK